MLHQQHRGAELVADAPDERGKRLDFLVIQAAGRLVEQKQFRPACQRAAEFHALLGAERQVRHPAAGNRPQTQQLEEIAGLAWIRGLLRAPRSANAARWQETRRGSSYARRP